MQTNDRPAHRVSVCRVRQREVNASLFLCPIAACIRYFLPISYPTFPIRCLCYIVNILHILAILLNRPTDPTNYPIVRANRVIIGYPNESNHLTSDLSDWANKSPNRADILIFYESNRFSDQLLRQSDVCLQIQKIPETIEESGNRVNIQMI